MPDNLTNLRAAVDRLVKARETTWTALASSIGYSPSYLYKQLRGARPLKIAMIQAMDAALDAHGELIHLLGATSFAAPAARRQRIGSTTLDAAYPELPEVAVTVLRLLVAAPVTALSMDAVCAIATVAERDAEAVVDRLREARLVDQVHGRLSVPLCVRTKLLEDQGPDIAAIRSRDVVTSLARWGLGRAVEASNAILPDSVSADLAPHSVANVHHRGPHTAKRAMLWFQEEMPTLAELGRAALHLGEPSLAWRLPVVCWPAWWLTGNWAKARAAAEPGLEAAHYAADYRGIAQCLQLLGWADGLSGSPEGLCHLGTAARIFGQINGCERELAWNALHTALVITAQAS